MSKKGAYDYWDDDLHGSVSPHEHRHLRDCFVELLDLMYEGFPEARDRLEAIKEKALNYKAPPPVQRTDLTE